MGDASRRIDFLFATHNDLVDTLGSGLHDLELHRINLRLLHYSNGRRPRADSEQCWKDLLRWKRPIPSEFLARSITGGAVLPLRGLHTGNGRDCRRMATAG